MNSPAPTDGVGLAESWIRRLTLLTGGVFVVLLGAWVLADPSANLQSDWTSFDNAGGRLRSGEEIYRPWNGDTEPLPYLYPPFVLWLAAPLGYLGFHASWVASALLSITTFVGGVGLALRSVSVSPAEVVTGRIVALTTGTVAGTVLIAQYSGVYVFAIGLAAYCWSRDRELLAGVALAILVMKPNLGIAVPVVLVFSRSWRVLGGFALGSVGALLSSIPLGLGLWSGFVDNIRNQTELQEMGLVSSSKMVTFIGGFQSLTGLETGAPATVLVWLVSTTIAGLATLSLWRPVMLRDSVPRALGGLAVFVIVANPRMYFYDASLIVVGALLFWAERKRYSPRAQHVICVLCMALWVFSWGTVAKPLNAAVGPLGLTLLVFVSLAAHRSSRTTGSPASTANDVSESRSAADVEMTRF